MKISSLLIPLLNGIGAQDEAADEAPVGISTGQGGKRRQLTRYLWHNPMCRDINTCRKYLLEMFFYPQWVVFEL